MRPIFLIQTNRNEKTGRKRGILVINRRNISPDVTLFFVAKLMMLFLSKISKESIQAKRGSAAIS